MDTAAQIQILDEAIYISRSINTLGERYKPNYSPSSYE